MISKTANLTLDEFVRLYDEQGPFELINGERITVNPTTFGHVAFTSALFGAMTNSASLSQIGEVFPKAPFTLTDPDDPNWVKGSRIPDLMYIRAERLASYRQANPDWREQPLMLVPDLAVEIVSPTDRYTDVNAKVELYLKDGVQLVWVFDQQRRAVDVHTQGSNQHVTLTSGQVLTGGELIPGFEISLDSIFQ